MNLLESIKIGSIIGKYLGGKESKDELVQLKSWLTEDSKHQTLFNSLKEERNIGTTIEEFETYNKELAWKRSVERINALSLRKVLIMWKIAAVFFFLVGFSGILFYINQHRLDTYTTVSTNNGQYSKILLPDSSVVWLSSGTKLSYNTNFAIGNRDVRLSGQAFFQVARNEKIPFTVKCKELKVKVVGTKFDVSAYPDDANIDVVLKSGSVELLMDDDKTFKQMLKPGEMAEFNLERKKMSISKDVNYKLTSWKDGILIFKDDPMDEVLKKLERWYNINIEVNNGDINHLVFNATIVNENIEEIFDLIKYSCGINYKIIPSNNPEVPVKVILTK